MRVHYVQHVPFEGLGSIGPWLAAHGHGVTGTRLSEAETFPEQSQFDCLIVMGGPMGVNDDRTHRWLRAEKQFIRTAVDGGKRVLGICLGAQLIASAMGAAVSRNEVAEIGWFPITTVPNPADSVFQFPSSLEVFHWHGDTFEIPNGAKRLAESAGCLNQAFQIENRVIGLQFHLETTPASAAEIISHCRDEIQPARYVQDEDTMLGVQAERYEAINGVMADVLDYLMAPAG